MKDAPIVVIERPTIGVITDELRWSLKAAEEDIQWLDAANLPQA